LAEFRKTLDAAEASIGRGEGIPITRESMRELAEDVKRRGHERLAVPSEPLTVHHVSPHAKADLDAIWQYICEESGSPEIADRQIDAIVERFFFWPLTRAPGGRAIPTSAPDAGTFPPAATSSSTASRMRTCPWLTAVRTSER
jgi:hypothetical protein